MAGDGPTDGADDANNTTVTNDWNADDYDDEHAFVSDYGESVVDLLDPQHGERILDLGCGTGDLTAEIADAVGDGDPVGDGGVVGVDQSAEMVDQARAKYPDRRFERADATTFEVDEPFDAVFSNAALHWISDQDAVTERVADALVPGGRFVAELGGHGNVARIGEAVLSELRERDHDAANPWYFPTVGEHASLLEDHGFEVRFARLFDRPTELDGGRNGLRNWLGMFGDSLLAGLDDGEQDAVISAVEDRLRPDLFDPERETWTADYRRLRFLAIRDV